MLPLLPVSCGSKLTIFVEREASQRGASRGTTSARCGSLLASSWTCAYRETAPPAAQGGVSPEQLRVFENDRNYSTVITGADYCKAIVSTPHCHRRCLPQTHAIT
eukprot:609320-Prymnesium_polylepis.1